MHSDSIHDVRLKHKDDFGNLLANSKVKFGTQVCQEFDKGIVPFKTNFNMKNNKHTWISQLY
jgi:hypothetical protein